MGTTVWIVTGTNGEYSDRSWWIESAHATEESAKSHVAALEAGKRAIETELGWMWEYHERHAKPYSYEAEEEWKVLARQVMDRHVKGARVEDNAYDWPYYHIEREDML